MRLGKSDASLAILATGVIVSLLLQMVALVALYRQGTAASERAATAAVQAAADAKERSRTSREILREIRHSQRRVIRLLLELAARAGLDTEGLSDTAAQREANPAPAPEPKNERRDRKPKPKPAPRPRPSPRPSPSPSPCLLDIIDGLC